MKLSPSNYRPPVAHGGVDFHLHTVTSDGRLSDKQVIDELVKAGVSTAAITNHDDASAGRDPAIVNYLNALGDEAPRIVPGVEITTWLDELPDPTGRQETHIIGLGVDPTHPGLHKALMKMRLGIAEKVKSVVRRLQADGFDISYRKLGRYARLRAVTYGSIYEQLVEKGYAKNRSEAKEKIVKPRLTDDGSEAQPVTLAPEEAIRLIHEAGGVAILAHPHRNVPSLDSVLLVDLMSKLKAMGLDAAEVYRTDVDDKDQPMIAACVEQAGLLPSGGSDFHWYHHNGDGRHPGDVHAPKSVWTALEQRIRNNGGVTDVRDLHRAPVENANASERFRLGRQAA